MFALVFSTLFGHCRLIYFVLALLICAMCPFSALLGLPPCLRLSLLGFFRCACTCALCPLARVPLFFYRSATTCLMFIIVWRRRDIADCWFFPLLICCQIRSVPTLLRLVLCACLALLFFAVCLLFLSRTPIVCSCGVPPGRSSMTLGPLLVRHVCSLFACGRARCPLPLPFWCLAFFHRRLGAASRRHQLFRPTLALAIGLFALLCVVFILASISSC